MGRDILQKRKITNQNRRNEMKKILVMGKIPEPKVDKYEKTCDNCGTVFEYESEDTRINEYGDGDEDVINCPLCGYKIHHQYH